MNIQITFEYTILLLGQQRWTHLNIRIYKLEERRTVTSWADYIENTNMQFVFIQHLPLLVQSFSLNVIALHPKVYESLLISIT